MNKLNKNQELERKFILKPEHTDLNEFDDFIFIEQAYLSVDNIRKTECRLRISNYSDAEITYKSKAGNHLRNEYNFEVELPKAIELMASSEIKLQKLRLYKKTYFDNSFDVAIDIYPDGLMIVEIEYNDLSVYEAHKNNPSLLPKYVGEDVTNQSEYSNFILAQDLRNRIYDFTVNHGEKFGTAL